MKLEVNKVIFAKGYFTESKYLYGTKHDLERKIGYHTTRLEKGFFIAQLLKIPNLNEFELSGYSITPAHKFINPQKLDIQKLKELARNHFLKIGTVNLLKILPISLHNVNMADDIQYPIGLGIPQWKLIQPVAMMIIRKIESNFQGTII